MEFNSITELAEAITSGSYLAEDSDLPFENYLYEEMRDFETAMVMQPGPDSISFHGEKQKQSFDLWISVDDNQNKVFQVDEAENEPECKDGIYTCARTICKADLYSTLEIPEYLELIKYGTSDLNEPCTFEMKSLDELIEMFFLIPCGEEKFPDGSFLLPVKCFLDHADHEAIEHIRSLFLVIDDENKHGAHDDMEWKVAWITKVNIFWRSFQTEYENDLLQFGLTTVIQPNDMAWFLESSFNNLLMVRLIACRQDIRKLTHQPILVTRVRPGCSRNFMNDEIETRKRIAGFIATLQNDEIRDEEMLKKLLDYKLLVPASRMQQIKHSFEHRFLKLKLRDQFNELMFLTNEIPINEITGFYQSKIKEIDEFMFGKK